MPKRIVCFLLFSLLLKPVIIGLCYYSAPAPAPPCCLYCLLPSCAEVSRSGCRNLGTIPSTLDMDVSAFSLFSRGFSWLLRCHRRKLLALAKVSLEATTFFRLVPCEDTEYSCLRVLTARRNMEEAAVNGNLGQVTPSRYTGVATTTGSPAAVSDADQGPPAVCHRADWRAMTASQKINLRRKQKKQIQAN